MNEENNNAEESPAFILEKGGVLKKVPFGPQFLLWVIGSKENRKVATSILEPTENAPKGSKVIRVDTFFVGVPKNGEDVVKHNAKPLVWGSLTHYRDTKTVVPVGGGDEVSAIHAFYAPNWEQAQAEHIEAVKRAAALIEEGKATGAEVSAWKE